MEIFLEINKHYPKPVLEILIFQKHKKWSSFLNFGWIWLVNELGLTFSAQIKCAQAQFNLIILSRVIEYTTTIQTDRNFRKTVFSDSGGLKT